MTKQSSFMLRGKRRACRTFKTTDRVRQDVSDEDTDLLRSLLVFCGLIMRETGDI